MKTFSSHSLLTFLAATAASVIFSGCNEDTKATASKAGINSVTPTPLSSARANTVPASGTLRGASAAPDGTAAPQPPEPPSAPEALPTTNGSSNPTTPTATSAPTPAGSVGAPNLQTGMANTNAWDEVKDYTYAQKAELVARVEAMIASLDANIATLRGSSPKPEMADSRSANLAALDNSRTILIQKRDALQYASAETWQSSKTEFRSAWRSMNADYEKLKAASN